MNEDKKMRTRYRTTNWPQYNAAQSTRLPDGMAGQENALVTLPLFRVVLNPRFTRLFYAVPRTSAARTAWGWGHAALLSIYATKPPSRVAIPEVIALRNRLG